jgi:hypothetical protein
MGAASGGSRQTQRDVNMEDTADGMELEEQD